MRAIFRYILMKGVRERFIITLLLAPAAMFVTPLLFLSLLNVFRGREAWPFTLAGNLSPADSAQILTMPAVFSASFIACTAALWVFRLEMKGHSIGLFILAHHPIVPTLVTTLFAAILGVLSYVVVATVLAVVTESGMPLTAMRAAGLIAAVLFGAAAGTFALGFSSEQSVLMPVYGISLAAAVASFGNNAPFWIATVFAAAIALTLAAPLVWRRRWSV